MVKLASSLTALLLFCTVSYAGNVWDLLELQRPGLEKVQALHRQGDDAGAAVALLDYFRCRENASTPEIPDASTVRIDSVRQRQADEALEHRFFVMDGYQPSYFYGDDIDWKYWPVKDNELRWQLHRHKWFSPMGYAFRTSGDERYAREWARQYLDWIVKNPLVSLDADEFEMTGSKTSLSADQENMRFAWRPLEVSHRIQDQVFQFQLFVDAEAFTPGFLLSFLENYHRHAEYLRHHFSAKGNHLLFEAQRMIYAGAFFPEFRDAGHWREEGVDILCREIQAQVYPDGGHWELDPHYHLACINIFCKALRMADLCGFSDAFPLSFRNTVEKMIEFYGEICYPDYTNPCFSDARITGKESVIEDWKRWSGLFPDNAFIRYMATEGREGTLPEHLSVAFKDSGFFIFRNGRDSNATQMIIKAGPAGEWHAQPDNGTFELWHKGLRLFPDSGSYVYAGDDEVMRWRNLFRSTAYHNTVTLNGEDLKTRRSRTRAWRGRGRVQKLVTENPSYPGLTHRRTIKFIAGKRFIIIDKLYGNATGTIAMHLHPGPGMEERMRIKVSGPTGMKARREQGWMSTSYREKTPRPHLIWEAEKKTNAPVVFKTIIDPLP